MRVRFPPLVPFLMRSSCIVAYSRPRCIGVCVWLLVNQRLCRCTPAVSKSWWERVVLWCLPNGIVNLYYDPGIFFSVIKFLCCDSGNSVCSAQLVRNQIDLFGKTDDWKQIFDQSNCNSNCYHTQSYFLGFSTLHVSGFRDCTYEWPQDGFLKSQDITFRAEVCVSRSAT